MFIDYFKQLLWSQFVLRVVLIELGYLLAYYFGPKVPVVLIKGQLNPADQKIAFFKNTLFDSSFLER